MMKNPDERPTPQELYDTDPFLQAAKRTPVDLEQWAVNMMERHNRKSHLAPQLSPATKALLRGEETPGTATMRSAQATPTSGVIPISSGAANGSSGSARPFPLRTASAQSVNESMNLPIRQAPIGRSGRPDTAGDERGDGGYRRPTPSQKPGMLVPLFASLCAKVECVLDPGSSACLHARVHSVTGSRLLQRSPLHLIAHYPGLTLRTAFEECCSPGDPDILSFCTGLSQTVSRVIEPDLARSQSRPLSEDPQVRYSCILKIHGDSSLAQQESDRRK
nr:hypothetical protein CFP56_78349 [Quercus suber]